MAPRVMTVSGPIPPGAYHQQVFPRHMDAAQAEYPLLSVYNPALHLVAGQRVCVVVTVSIRWVARV